MKHKAAARVAAAAIIIFIAFITAFCSSAADTNVSYAGRADKFVFVPKTTDLFDNFKNVVPGDVVTQDITVKNTSGETVQIFLRADPVDGRFSDFLSRLTLAVEVDDRAVWFSGSAADMGETGMTQNRSLGMFGPGANVGVEVTLGVPLNLSDEFQGGYGEVVWVFTVAAYDGSVVTTYNPPVTYNPPPVTNSPAVTERPITGGTDTGDRYDITKYPAETRPGPDVTLPAVTAKPAEPTAPSEDIIIEDSDVPKGGYTGAGGGFIIPATGDDYLIIIWCGATVLLTVALVVILNYRSNIFNRHVKGKGKDDIKPDSK